MKRFAPLAALVLTVAVGVVACGNLAWKPLSLSRDELRKATKSSPYYSGVQQNIVLPKLASSGPSIALKIENIESASFGYTVRILVQNTGRQPVTLVLATPPTGPTLQSLDVQQWDNAVGWEHCGPCRDVASDVTLTLPPNEGLSDNVPIADGTKTFLTAVCPRKVRSLRGRVRAILYFAYANDGAFKNRVALLQNVTSDPIQLPPWHSQTGKEE